MKKTLISTALFLFLCLLALLFLQFKLRAKPQEEKAIWRLEKIEEFKIMSMTHDNASLSDAKSALFLKKIRHESLPLSAVLFFNNSSTLGAPKEINCRIVYKNVKMENTLNDLNVSREDSFYQSSGRFSFNLSDLNKTVTEPEILEFIKAFPLDEQIEFSVKPVYDSGHFEAQDWINLY